MVIDTSALVAILQDEPERRAFNELIEAAAHRRLSTASFVELSIVVEARRGAEGIRDLDLFLLKFPVFN
jgi:ribonuclease VapC